MKVNLFVTKNIVRGIAPSFNGDARLASVAFKRIAETVSQCEDDEAKTLAGDIITEMAPQFKGNVDSACDAFKRVYGTILEAKRSQPEA